MKRAILSLRPSLQRRLQLCHAEPSPHLRTLCCSNSDSSDPNQRRSLPKRPGKRPRSIQLPAPSSSAAPKANQSTFVSDHFSLNRGDVERYLTRHGLKYRRTSEHAVVEVCPFCHPTNGKSDNLYKLYILLDTGVFCCHRCAAKGKWFDFRRAVGPTEPGLQTFNDSHLDVHSISNDLNGQKPVSLVLAKKESQEGYVRGLWNEHRAALDVLKSTRALTEQVLKKYGVGSAYFNVMEDGIWKRHLCHTFPMYDSNRRLVRHKVRSIQTKSGMRLEPKGGSWGLFGLDTVPPDAEEVILTEGEFDAMAVFQATGRPAISVPNGANSLPISLLPALEQFKTIYLWMDDDVPGQEGARHFAEKLGMKRCRSVQGFRVKDANDALRAGLDMEEMLGASRVIAHEGLATFEDFKDEVYRELTNFDELSGVRCLSLPSLNDLITGHRRGELTIFSGHTGVGKTTLLSQLALDYCLQGVPTLWGSFEIGNVRLARLMLQQFHASQGGSDGPAGLAERFEEWAERFSELPLVFMRYHGSNAIETIIDAMEYANYVHDCSHVVLDNLQFMTSGQGGRDWDRFQVMDHALGEIRAFCTAKQVHVSLVVHPRKVDDDSPIQTASVFGSAKATQEADNLVILQRTAKGPTLEVKKNRFDGTLGSVSLRFDGKNRVFWQTDRRGVWPTVQRAQELQSNDRKDGGGRRRDGVDREALLSSLQRLANQKK